MEVKLFTKEEEQIKKISFETLKCLSDSNVERLNRNIDVDTLLNEHPNIINYNVELKTIMTHNHHMLKPTDPHYRCFVIIQELGGLIGIQDVFVCQWEELNCL